MASQSSSGSFSVASLALTGVIFLILLLIGVLFFLGLPHPNNDYYLAMLATGIFALVVGLAAYLANAFTRSGRGIMLASTGSFWFGVVMLLGADLATPDSDFGGASTAWTLGGWRIVFLIIILIIVAVGLGVQIWQQSAQKQVERREDLREQWRQSTGVVGPGQRRP